MTWWAQEKKLAGTATHNDGHIQIYPILAKKKLVKIFITKAFQDIFKKKVPCTFKGWSQKMYVLKNWYVLEANHS